MRVVRAAGDTDTILVTIAGTTPPIDAAGLCERVRAVLERCDAKLVVCDVGALTEADAAAVDVVARLELTARRLGRVLRLRHACTELRELLVLTGLADIAPPVER